MAENINSNLFLFCVLISILGRGRKIASTHVFVINGYAKVDNTPEKSRYHINEKSMSYSKSWELCLLRYILINPGQPPDHVDGQYLEQATKRQEANALLLNVYRHIVLRTFCSPASLSFRKCLHEYLISFMFNSSGNKFILEKVLPGEGSW